MLTKLRHTLELVRFSHSIFALPYALGVMIVAAHGLPAWQIIVKILIAMVAARTMAMAFNRWLDAEIDARNPRTATRHIPAGILSRSYVLGLTIAMAVVFVVTCSFINPLAFYLSPIALIVLLGYSACKRFTHLAHFVLGLALGISPVGAWIAVTGQFSWAPVWVCVSVILWTAAFDIIYAIGDETFDRNEKLHSMVVKLGVNKSLFICGGLYVLMIPPLLVFGYITHMNIWYYLPIVVLTTGINDFIFLLALYCTGIKKQGQWPVIWWRYNIFSCYFARAYFQDNPSTLAQNANLLLYLNGLTGLVFFVGCVLSVFTMVQS